VPHRASADPDLTVARRAAVEWSVLSIGELLACGLSRGGIKTRVQRGQLHWKFRGVYAVGHSNLSLEGCFLAAVKACGKGARLSGYAAAALYTYVEWDHRFPEVTVPGRGTRSHVGIRIRRTSVLDAADVRIHKGIPVTSPARTLVDLAAIVGYRDLRRALRQALSLGHVTLGELVAILHRLEGRRGSKKLTKVVAEAVPTRSELEDLVHDLIRWPKQGIVVEADSRQWHDNPVARAEDAERRALLEAAGERVLSVTHSQAVADSRATVDRIRKAGAPLATRGTSLG
jgi:hypothetical protein